MIEDEAVASLDSEMEEREEELLRLSIRKSTAANRDIKHDLEFEDASDETRQLKYE